MSSGRRNTTATSTIRRQGTLSRAASNLHSFFIGEDHHADMMTIHATHDQEPRRGTIDIISSYVTAVSTESDDDLDPPPRYSNGPVNGAGVSGLLDADTTDSGSDEVIHAAEFGGGIQFESIDSDDSQLDEFFGRTQSEAQLGSGRPDSGAVSGGGGSGDGSAGPELPDGADFDGGAARIQRKRTKKSSKRDRESRAPSAPSRDSSSHRASHVPSERGSSSGRRSKRNGTGGSSSSRHKRRESRPEGGDEEEGAPPKKKKVKVFFPWFIFIMTFIDVVMMILEIAVNGGLAPITVNPFGGPDAETLLLMGAKYGPKIKEEGQWWRFFSPIILHVGVIHLAFNMVTQLRVGASMEQVFSWKRIMPIYLVSGVTGNMLSVIFLPEQLQVGASGALYGLLGSCIIDVLNNWNRLPQPWKVSFNLGIQMFIAFLIGLLPFVDNFAHIGGFISGIFTSVIFLPQVLFGKNNVANRTKSLIIGVICLFIYIVTGFSFYYADKNAYEWCPLCVNLNCVNIGNTDWCGAAELDSSGEGGGNNATRVL